MSLRRVTPLIFAYAMLLLVGFAALGFAQMSCATQGYTHNFSTQLWSGTKLHLSGSHWLNYTGTTKCTYKDVATPHDMSPCDLTQLSTFLTSPGDNGFVSNYPADYHRGDPKAQVYQAHVASGATPLHDFSVGMAVQNCIVGLGCDPITLGIPPFTYTAPDVIEATPTLTAADSCVAKYYHCPHGARCSPCSCANNWCKATGCASPLVMDVSGIGPFIKDTLNTGGSNFSQFSGIKGEHAKDAISFAMEQDKTGAWKKQTVAWMNGPRIAMLVLCESDACPIENADHIFGNRTHCGAELCRDGFRALLFKCDDPISGNGGNGDHICDDKDPLFAKLHWLMGKPESPERKLYTMAQMGVKAFPLWPGSFRELRGSEILVDEHGNAIRFQGMADLGTIRDASGGARTNNRELWDVWLLQQGTHDDLDSK